MLQHQIDTYKKNKKIYLDWSHGKKKTFLATFFNSKEKDYLASQRLFRRSLSLTFEFSCFLSMKRFGNARFIITLMKLPTSSSLLDLFNDACLRRREEQRSENLFRCSHFHYLWYHTVLYSSHSSCWEEGKKCQIPVGK